MAIPATLSSLSPLGSRSILSNQGAIINQLRRISPSSSSSIVRSSLIQRCWRQQQPQPQLYQHGYTTRVSSLKAHRQPLQDAQQASWHVFKYSTTPAPSKSEQRDEDKTAQTPSQTPSEAQAQAETQESTLSETQTKKPEQSSSAIGGFVRGLVGGQQVAAEDEYIKEARKQGIEISPRTELVATKRRRREGEDDEDKTKTTSTIRDRLFSRFAGSAFIKGALDAKERITERVEVSDSRLLNFFRDLYDRFFAENEMAQVIKEIQIDNKDFRISEFLREMEVKVIPKILSAYLRCDEKVLKEHCTEDAYRMLLASIKERATEGVEMDPSILNIDDVELTAARFLEDEPVLIISFSAQQINCLRDKNGNIVEGKEDDIRAVYYLWAMVQDRHLYEFEEDVPTGGSANAKEGEETLEHSQAKSENAKLTEESKSEPGREEERNEKKEEKSETKERSWKILEMVIRGAHSTI